MNEIQTKFVRVFLLANHSHLFSFFATRFLFLQIHATSYSFYSSVTVHCKGEWRKHDRKQNPLPCGLRNPNRKLKSGNSQDFAQNPQQNCPFMNSASGLFNSLVIDFEYCARTLINHIITEISIIHQSSI